MSKKGYAKIALFLTAMFWGSTFAIGKIAAEVFSAKTYVELTANRGAYMAEASSVVDCLRFECERIGVQTVCGFKIEKIKSGKDFVLFSGQNRVFAKAVICCTGLYAGGERLGSDGSLYRTLKDMGLKTVKISPSIVQLKTETEYVKQLKGIKIDDKTKILIG